MIAERGWVVVKARQERVCDTCDKWSPQLLHAWASRHCWEGIDGVLMCRECLEAMLRELPLFAVPS